MEKTPGYRFINTNLPNGSRQLNKEDSGRPCLKDAFKDILLVIVYNYPLYDSIPDLVALYEPAFPNLLFCGPPDNAASPDILTVKIIRGYLGYECLGRAIRQYPGYTGYFYSNDDVILKFWSFPDFDREKIWESMESGQLFSRRVKETVRLKWKWWNSGYGLQNCRRAFEDVANMTLDKENFKGVHLLNTLIKNSKDTLRCFRGRSDVLYIPQKHAKAFSILSNIFYTQKVFLEIAAPTINRLVEREENIGRLPGRYIRPHFQDPRGKDSRFLWHLYFTKDTYLFIHPFKLHGKDELDNKLNLVMFKRVLVEQVKKLTNCDS